MNQGEANVWHGVPKLIWALNFNPTAWPMVLTPLSGAEPQAC